MPNWATNLVTIEGDKETLDEIQARLATPYKTYFPDYKTGEPEELDRTGDFLLWNIRQPINLTAYWSNEEKHRGKGDDFATAILAEFQDGEGWYAWNVRNWGTKWEVGDAYLSRQDTRLSYSFDTAWSPAVPAMETLAQMYPTTTIRISAYDESMGWAVTIEYANGDSIETEGEPDHKFLVEDMGEDCWRCGDGYDDYTDADREEYGCPSTAK